LVYTLELTFNLNEFNPRYPQSPQNLGETIRKARMDQGLLIRELAAQLGVTEDTVINWEIRGMKPEGRNSEKIREFLLVKLP
jgi:DNA-binding transcriptional regulator YiaG